MFLRKFALPLAIVIIILAVYLAIHLISQSEKPYNFTTSSETVIKQVRSLNRLETAQFTLEKVIDAGTSGGRLQQLFFGDRLLLIAHGSVIAGVDLSTLTKDDITIDRTSSTLSIALPPAKILVTTLDVGQTRVYDRQTGLLSKGDKDLESAARAEAEKVITQAACSGGILDEAAKNARQQLSALLKGLEFQKVIITIPSSSCE